MNSEPAYMATGQWQQPGAGHHWGYNEDHSSHHYPTYTTSSMQQPHMSPTAFGTQVGFLPGLGMEMMRPHSHALRPAPMGSPNGNIYNFQHYSDYQHHSGHMAQQLKQMPSMQYSYPMAPPHFTPGPMMAGVPPLSYPVTSVTPSSARASQSALFPSSPPLSRRGPPRKPKRSGNAIWVGNIPLGASIESLKDHFSRNATNDIESVFLMSKSNCAFVNYRSKEASEAAVERFNHSFFGAVRLLCRMRRDTQSRDDSISSAVRSTERDELATDGAKEGIEDLTAQIDGLGISNTDDEKENSASTNEGQQTDATASTASTAKPASRADADRFFVLKSLSKEDLNDSLQRGTWETQLHNQNLLHSAYRSALAADKNVYLIFSVNKSGEYFGYARMCGSPFDDDAIRRTSSTESVQHKEGLKVVRTPATATAPRGCIVDDAARGTLFWEAEREGGNPLAVNGSNDGDGTRSDDSGNGELHERSRPFRIEWLSVRKVTFQRTKGMKNSWNSGKEVKVARDGTELETETGKGIVGLFYEGMEGDVRREA